MSFRLVQFFRQMAVLVRSGVPVLAALDGCRQGCTDDPHLERALLRMSEELRGGARIAEAVAAAGGPFTGLHASVVAAGESSGRLDEALLELAEREENQGRVIRRVRSALTYPMFVIALAAVGLFALIKFLLPVLVSLTRSAGHPPGTALLVLTRLASVLDHPSQLAAATAVAACGVLMGVHVIQQPRVAIWLERAKLRIPIFRIRCHILMCHSLASLLRTGLPLVDTLRLVSGGLGNRALEARFEEAVENVRRGESLSVAIRGIDLLPRSFQGVVAMGEESGCLEDALVSLARLYEWELELAVERFLKTLEPLTVAGVGGVVLGLMVVTFGPMYDMLRSI